MPKHKLISTIREQISVNKTEDALKALIDFLDERAKEFGKMGKTARLISSDFYELRQRQLQDTIKPEEYQRELNKVQSRLLALIDDLEEGRVKPSEQAAPSVFRKYLLPSGLVGAGLIVLGLWLGGVFAPQVHKPDIDFGNGNSGQLGLTDDAKGCPAFDANSTFRVLILPLQSLDGSTASFASSIKSGLDNITLGPTVSIKEHKNYDLEAEGLPSFTDAERIGNDCVAQMVIWGTYEKPGDDYRVNIKYFFLGDESKLQLHKLEVQNSSDIAIVDAVSSIQTNEFLTNDIQSIINIMAGVMAHKHNDPKAAAKELAKALAEGKLASEETEKAVEFLLADNLMMDTTNYKQAIEVYSRILEKNPDNTWAHNNRGLLYFKMEKYPEAIKDFDVTIKSPKTSARDQVLLNVLKSDAHQAIGQPERASEDLKEAQKVIVAPTIRDNVTPLIQNRMRTVKSVLEQQERLSVPPRRILDSQ